MSSSCTIVGFFELTHGHRVRTDTKRTDGTSFGTYHVYYDSSVICSETVSLPAEIRKYSPPSEVALPENTVAFVVAKVNVPAGKGPGNVLLEAWHVAPVPGDPTSDGYDERPPDFCRPLIFALGTVGAGHDGPAGGAVMFPVTVSDYVRGSVKEMTIRYASSMLTLNRKLIPFAFQDVHWTGQRRVGGMFRRRIGALLSSSSDDVPNQRQEVFCAWTLNPLFLSQFRRRPPWLSLPPSIRWLASAGSLGPVRRLVPLLSMSPSHLHAPDSIRTRFRESVRHIHNSCDRHLPCRPTAPRPSTSSLTLQALSVLDNGLHNRYVLSSSFFHMLSDLRSELKGLHDPSHDPTGCHSGSSSHIVVCRTGHVASRRRTKHK
jgi:hypothetical protein